LWPVIGAYVPIPGIDPKTLADIFKQHAGGVFGVFNMFLRRLAVPHVHPLRWHHALHSASIIIQLMTIASTHLARA